MDVIYNKKNVDGKDVVQLEMAMGSAISNFKKSICINVPRNRFFPIKKCSDILLLMSNLVTINNGIIECSKDKLPLIDLDERYYKNYNEFILKFPNGIPNIKDLNSLKVRGNIVFKGNITLKDDVEIYNQ